MIRVSAALAMLAVVLTACGGGSGGAPGGGAGQAPAVVARGIAFVPKALEVAAGTTVEWTNEDSVEHTVTSGRPGAADAKWDARLEGSGGTFGFTFAQAGTYAYFCSIHTSMTGTVTVK